jgi:GYF domain 2
MNYHLHRQGQHEGIFPEEELRRRRAAGELTGAELVWCEGMAEWQGLDAVLGIGPAGSRGPMPPPIPASARTRRTATWVTVSVVSLFVLLWVGLAILGIRFRSAFSPMVINRSTRTSFPTYPTYGARGLEEASRPVTWNSNTLTAKDVQRQQREFRLKQWVEGYKQRGDRSEACDEMALLYLETSVERGAGGDAFTNRPPTLLFANSLANNPACTDPLVLALTGIDGNGLSGNILRLKKALNGFENSKHLAYPKLCATVDLGNDLLKSKTHPEEIPALDTSARDLFRQAFTDGSLTPADQDEYAEILVNGWGRDFFDRNEETVCDIAKNAGSSYEWLALVLEGQRQVNDAWKVRGGGYANTVTEEAWKGFAERLGLAQRALTRAWKLRPELPIAPAMMIRVAMGESSVEEMRTWFDRAVAAQIDYPLAWSSMRWGLRPRWFGSLEAMEAFGATGVNTRRFDTDVPRMYYDTMADYEAEMSAPIGTHYYNRPEVWPVMQRMYEGYIAEPSQRENQAGWRTAYASAAYLAGKYDVARTQLEALDWKPSGSMANWGVDLSLLAGEVAARTGRHGEEVAEAETAWRADLCKAALDIYDRLTNASDADERTREFARCRCAGLEIEQKLSEGGWVDFLPQSDDDPNWVYKWGEAHKVADGALEIESGPNGHLCYSRVRPGPNFEVKGEFELVKSSTKDFRAGLVMGLFDGVDSVRAHWHGLQMAHIDAEGNTVDLGLGWAGQEVAKRGPIRATDTAFDVVVTGDQWTVTVNGREVMDGVTTPTIVRLPAGSSCLGLGAFNDNNDTVIRYRNVQVRKLP